VRVLGLDLSTSTGWALFEGDRLANHGRLEQVHVTDFNVNAHPNESPHYPLNIIEAAEKLAGLVGVLLDAHLPDHVVIENTVKGRNRHTQRILEWIHFTVLQGLLGRQIPFSYLDPSQWRSVLEIRLTAEDKKNNKDVRAGKKRGKVGKKHLAVREANERFGLSLKMKDDDVADAILLGLAYVTPSS
jgi:hypothetical protein